ncbi:MAG: hypothetical protein LBM02_09595 [Lachnospiraceae bacterium]|jgi:hypothetical protein|nr:hypothetical protein [Lachnospiraceae bacterium]
MGKIKRLITIVVVLSVVLIIGGCNMNLSNNEEKYKDEFTSTDKADKFLVKALEKRFVGRKFQVIHDKDNYILNGKDQGTSLYALVKDQDGNIAQAGVRPRGLDSLWTDYLASYYIPKVAEPIEKILDKYDCVDNYNIDLDDWDENDVWNNLNWNTKEFFNNTHRHYRLGIFLQNGKSEQEYVDEVTQIYNTLYDKQDEGFDVFFFISNSLYYGKSKTLEDKQDHYCGYYVYESWQNHFEGFSKDSNVTIKEDFLPLNQKNTYNIDGFTTYGTVWKKLPKKVTEPEEQNKKKSQ